MSNRMSIIAFKKSFSFFRHSDRTCYRRAEFNDINSTIGKSSQIRISVKNKDEKIIPNRLNQVIDFVWTLGSALSEFSECPNRAECPNESRAVRNCPTVRACPTNILGFVRPKAEPRPFCPSRAILSELSDVRMPTPAWTRNLFSLRGRFQ